MLLQEEVKKGYTPKLNKAFAWFDDTFVELISQAFSNFWEKEYKIKLVGVIENNYSLFKTEEFFVTKLAVKKGLNVGFRVPKSTICMLFKCLGNSLEEFDLKKITELEAKIINSFNDYVFQEFKKVLSIASKKYYDSSQTINLVFSVQEAEEKVCIYIVSLPKDVIEIKENANAGTMLNLKDFAKTKAIVNINVGSTKMSLNELKNLTNEDIVLLDESNLNRMIIKIGENETYFKVSPEPALIVNLEDNGDNEIMDNSSLSQDMWDNIQVEIGAEFDKIKLSLGELKQISEGLVVDISSIYENKIFLKVANKNIAQGELVIINDRYGVKIDKVLNNTETEEITQNTQVATENEEIISETQETVVEEEVAEDDFDYSDFEIEDENI